MKSFGGKGSQTDSLNHEGVCRTALATPGLLKILRGTFWEIRHIQIQIYPQTSIEPKYGAFT